jgi:hypothetical protein
MSVESFGVRRHASTIFTAKPLSPQGLGKQRSRLSEATQNHCIP